MDEHADDSGAGEADDTVREAPPTGSASTTGSLPATDEVLRKFAALGAQQAFQLDPALVSQFTAASMVSLSTLPQALLGSIAASVPPPQLPPELLAQFAALAPSTRLPASFWESAASTVKYLGQSASVDALYSEAHLRAAKSGHATSPRATRTAESFFNDRAVEITSVDALLSAFATIQQKQRAHQLVWRGQQNAGWSVHSSLYRRLGDDGVVDEDRLIETEIDTFAAAATWGTSSHRPLEFLATLQHHGAPTRLLDATTDPEVAAWFAVEADPSLDGSDGLVLGWGRAPRTKTGIAEPDQTLPQDTEVPFWHAWTNEEERRRVDWGTGTKTWTWFPPALNERMRAQRAGFVLEAGPILSTDVVAVFTGAMPTDWRASEIARATSVIGLPSRHDVKTKRNEANLVPLFTFRIASKAKPQIRDYLASKGLTSSTIYPDLDGLVRHLVGPFGPR
ncbi:MULTISPECIES: FRG domain-containing protein [Microbacterium]|uniref:FRG domain-containing protein n=1 Tax=Microbacterium TaxID=33882 RepID=UPI00277DD709|nr:MULTISPECIES: FRG domain-containing protein [Microbacterium]MDQ1082210.1 hypothetical protein [Microbacterium sp. SORGH_AS_0344]MDQ1169019.1 hypothetical protein [Microbacterium proteolyticum]